MPSAERRKREKDKLLIESAKKIASLDAKVAFLLNLMLALNMNQVQPVNQD